MIVVLTRAGTIHESRDMTWELLPSQLPPLQSCLLIGSQRREGRIVTDSNDDVENEAWSLVGRAVAHTLLKRAVVLSGAGELG